MNNSTSRCRRYSTRAAAIATTAAVIFGAAACGSETASDIGQAPAAPVAPKSVPQGPISADAQDSWAEADRLELYRRHYGADLQNHENKYRGQAKYAPGPGRP